MTAGKTRPSPDHAQSRSDKAEAGQQALAEKAANTTAAVKARVESSNMPDKPPWRHPHTPNSFGRKQAFLFYF